MSDEPYLFDVSLIALAHAGTPVGEPALEYVRQAVAGDIDAVVPHPALIGAHRTLRHVYRYSNSEAAQLMGRFRGARRIHWFGGMSEELLRDGFALAGTENIDGWDRFYGAVAHSEGVETILTLDADFERVDGVTCEVILDADQFEELNEYINQLT